MAEKGYEPLRSFYLEPISDDNYDPVTAVDEMPVTPSTPTVRGNSKVRYYNLTGQESNRPFEGINIEVTTNNDNTHSAKKVLRTN